MAAGLGFKTFTTGEVLSAADTNGYLMQGVLVFASAAARDSAITSPQEGQFAYLKDTNVTTYYTGSAWTNLDTTGMVNPMTTTGDTIYSSSGSTPARLGIGSTGNVLTVSGGVPTWAAPAAASSGLTYLTGASFSGASSVSLPNSTFSSTYRNYMMKLTLTGVSANSQMCYRMRAGGTDTSSAIHYWSLTGFAINNTAFTNAGLSETSMKPHNLTATADYDAGEIAIYEPNTTQITRIVATGAFASNGGTVAVSTGAGFTPNSTQYDAMTFFPSSGTITGFYKVYGIANS